MIKHLINPVVTEIFFRGTKLNICLAFFAKSYFPEPKNIRIDFTNYFIMKIPNRKDFQQIPFNQSSSINCRDLMNLKKKCTAKTYSFLVIYHTPSSDNTLSFRKNLLKRM